MRGEILSYKFVKKILKANTLHFMFMSMRTMPLSLDELDNHLAVCVCVLQTVYMLLFGIAVPLFDLACMHACPVRPAATLTWATLTRLLSITTVTFPS